MSVKIMSLVWDNFNRGGSDKLAMLAMADWCNDSGGSLYPSISAIARKINTSDCQARRIVHGLIDEGFLLVVGNHDGGNPKKTRQYQINLNKLLTTSANATPSIDATPSAHARRPLAPMRVTPSAHASQTIKEPSIEPPNKATATQLPDWLPVDEWKDYIETRKIMRAPMTERAKQLAIGKLDDLRKQGFSPGDVLNQSIYNGWKGLFPIKQDHEKGKNRHEQLADKLADLTGRKRKAESSDQGVINGTAERLD